MLNEIFKGMDNASEAINENFKNGSVVESGSNEQGTYVRYGDGTQICWKNDNWEKKLETTITAGVLYRSEYIGWDFPKPFSTPPVLAGNASGYVRWPIFPNVPESDKTSFYVVSIAQGEVNNLSAVAFGRWN